MERQETQPLLDEEVYQHLLRENANYNLLETASDMSSGSNLMASDKNQQQQQIQRMQEELQLQLQQGQLQQGQLQQDQLQLQQDQQQQQQSLTAMMPNNLVRTIIKPETSDNSHILTEETPNVGNMLYAGNDDGSLTPPEQLIAIPYEAIHSNASTFHVAVSGSNVIHYQQQIGILQNNNTAAFRFVEQQAAGTSSNNNNDLNTSNCNSTSNTVIDQAYSPATLEASDCFADFGACGTTNNQNFAADSRDQKTFAPELKFNPAGNGKYINNIASNVGGSGGADGDFVLDGITSGQDAAAVAYLPRYKSIDVTTLKNWPGKNNLQLQIPTDNKYKNKWCYSPKLGRIYAHPYRAMEIGVSVDNWESLGGNAMIRLVAVYEDSNERTSPVYRCYTCPMNDKESGKHLVRYLLQVSNSGAVHSIMGSSGGSSRSGRHIVTVPMERPHTGEDKMTLLIKCVCMTSCVGGPNRRPFVMVFSLLVNDVEQGRCIMKIKCCKGTPRDMKKDENDAEIAETVAAACSGDGSSSNTLSRAGAAPTTTPLLAPSATLAINGSTTLGTANAGADGESLSSPIFASPKRQGSQKAGSSGLNIANKRKMSDKQKKQSAGSYITLSSESESEKGSSKKVKMSKFAFATADPDGACFNMRVPLKFKKQMIEYLWSLKVIEQIKKDNPEEYNRQTQGC